MSALASVSNHPKVPLFVAPVENKERLLCIYSELKGWQIKANEREWGGSEDFGPLEDSERMSLENYYTIVKKTSEVILSKIGYCGKENEIKFKGYTIMAAYDAKGNVQGVAAAEMKGTRGVAVKVDYLVTAFWNMPFNNPTNLQRTKGAGTCLLAGIVEILPHDGAVFLEPTPEAVAFYANCYFTKIPNWMPKSDGACCGMQLPKKSFHLLKEKVKEQITVCKEEQLPPTNKHYLKYLAQGFREIVTSSKV